MSKLPLNIRTIFWALWNVLAVIGFASATWHHDKWSMAFWGFLWLWNIGVDYALMYNSLVRHEYVINWNSKKKETNTDEKPSS